MSNVLKFPKPFKGPRVSRVMRKDIERIRAQAPARDTMRGVLAFAWMLVRIPLFLVLYWLRLPVMLVCNFVSVPMLLAFLFTWYAFPTKTHMVWSFGIVSFLAFTILWLYDLVLMSLSPQDMVKTL
jgi:hypothetical protein